MSDRWRRELRRLSELNPSHELLDRAHEGPRSDVDTSRHRSRLLAGAVAFAVFAGGSILAWQAFGPAQSIGPATAGKRGYPSAPASGYYILFPDRVAEPGRDPFSVKLTALTNLPDGTLLDISAGNAGTCCPPVKDGEVSITAQNGSCYGFVGAAANSPGFDVEITARPDTDTFVFPGPGDTKPPQQPENVLETLGAHFENLTGDQVVEQPDGSKWLVAKTRYEWPEPQCGGDPIPLFGGPDCDPEEFQQQLQGSDLEESMIDVMGALGQGRMCEFWSVMLPPDVETEHPWAGFAAEWRPWLLRQDFSDAESSGNWEEGPFSWRLADQRGDRYFVDVIHDQQRIASLELRPLPDFCPPCDPSVVPFWGVVDWTLFSPRG